VAVPPPLLAGRYEVGGLLGAGGMAQVHRARDRVLDRPVAVKLLPPGTPADAVERFRAEGRRHAAVRHPGVLPVLDAGADAGWHYLVLELAGRGSLAQLLRRRPVLPAAEAAGLLRQLAAALAAAHRAGVVHRDVKPGNVLLDDEGRARLTDFGISLGAGGRDGLPADQVLGTRDYLSPERLRGAPAARPTTSGRSACWATSCSPACARATYRRPCRSPSRRTCAGPSPPPSTPTPPAGRPTAPRSPCSWSDRGPRPATSRTPPGCSRCGPRAGTAGRLWR